MVSFRHDPRKLINALLFFLTEIGLYLSFVTLAYQYLPQVHDILLAVLYQVVSPCLVIFAIFMIVNGCVVFRKEGKRFANSLSIPMGIGILA